MNAERKPRKTVIPNPAEPKITPGEFAGRQPKTSVAEDKKRLTVDIPPEVHRALSYAKADTGQELRHLVTEALRAFPAVARHLPTDPTD